MKTKTILFALASLIFLTNCANKTKQPKEESLWDETIHQKEIAKVKPNDTLSDDDKLYGWDDVMNGKLKETPIMNGVPKEYFRKNNKYKDWDANNPKQVLLEYIVEKNGTASNVEVKKSSGIKKLDDEALRLIKEAKYLPGTNQKGELVRCGNTVITVYFPTK